MVSRLLGMVYILMNRGTVTARELAERFEVSVRTVYRDVEALGMAGIPVYARQGKNGGISLMEQFVLDKRLISGREQTQILAALASLEETGAQEGETLRKLAELFHAEPVNWVSIDFSDWSGRRQELYRQIKEAVLGRYVLQFDYYGQRCDMSSRRVEPTQLLFKEYTWYLRAYCRTCQDMRLFKLLRMKRVEITREHFEPRQEQERAPEKEQIPLSREELPEIVMRVSKSEAYRVYDRFEEEEITVLPEGDFEIRFRYILDDWVYGLILSFGASARVMEPEWVRREVGRRIRAMAELYPAE